MSYIPLEDYPRAWIFRHASLPISPDQLALIKPMTAQRAAQFWKENISAVSPDAERLSDKDWAMQTSSWLHHLDWMPEWESDESPLPASILEFIDWQDDVTVYFCYEKYNVIETKWSVFKQHWKNFLFYDDGPILLGRRRDQALWFHTDGSVKLGHRS
ncbi:MULTISPECIES: DUF2947 domain-containing protein [unclassified Vibrio]|uniref:DUF2947 domain-containing protein n=1 Tax=Vibrio sp. HB236076 TaxID=3232307 RepID=A0AB39H6L2_9VIBR|nr:DUF2947 domain-containing protein [Vibrio sp. HB161653]MDP5253494.1 DUF2947 domain-containing protein [Vibrio sp. HB161653]